MKGPIFTISGLRGVIGRELTPEVAVRTASAYGTMLSGGRVALARDCRSSGEMLYAAVTAGLLSTGCSVLSLGVCPTPTVPLLVETEKLAGGIMITASHNPPEWNGLKLISPAAAALNRTQLGELKRILRANRLTHMSWDGLGRVIPRDDAIDIHIRRILESVLFRNRRRRRLRVGIDACHGAASLAADRLIRAMCSVPFGLYCSPDKGSCFPRPPEPTPDHLKALGTFVRKHRLDLGVAFDPDGDRFSGVDERGTPLGEETSVMMATDYVLRQKPGPVVVNLSTTMGIDEIAARHGAPVFRSRVGEAEVVAKMNEVSAVVGGEGNGGVIIPAINRARDGLVALAVLLQTMADQRAPLSAIAAQFPRYPMLKDKLSFPAAGWSMLRSGLRAAFAAERIDAADGLKVLTRDGWIHVRPSNTEPIVRIIAEARSREQCRKMVAEVRAALKAPLAKGLKRSALNTGRQI